ncbi:hypothetical protein ONZ51_g4983 [Trametes cubensis]|uniref:DUF6699 domain-containing protein n=1 Tax=Trametes cubensis TaxID=1111947 RepID=A0AAD7TXA0_9APHY|nr:hypothetical protein ONZ51_g4983 [Trametes cubensis]
MSAPYGYQQFYYPTPYIYPYVHQAYVSPFIPPVTLPASPQLPPRDERRVHWDDEPYVRPRRPSWHGGLAPPPTTVPFPSPPVMVTALPPMVPVAAQPQPYYTHYRRASDSCLPPAAWVSYPALVQPVAFQSPFQSAPPSPAINPLLNGENAGGPMLLFDLSLNTFSPQRITSGGQKTGTPLTLEELREPATYPSTTPPITVYDVLMAIHRTVQRQISHVDWARLSQSDMRAISAAYTRRCRTFPSAAAFEEAQGVRRVDYLRDNYMFRGLVRANSKDGFSKMKLLVGPVR